MNSPKIKFKHHQTCKAYIFWNKLHGSKDVGSHAYQPRSSSLDTCTCAHRWFSGCVTQKGLCTMADGFFINKRMWGLTDHYYRQTHKHLCTQAKASGSHDKFLTQSYIHQGAEASVVGNQSVMPVWESLGQTCIIGCARPDRFEHS